MSNAISRNEARTPDEAKNKEGGETEPVTTKQTRPRILPCFDSTAPSDR